VSTGSASRASDMSPSGPSLLTAKAADGTVAQAIDEGQGRAILIVHPGMTTEAGYARVARLLAPRFRVLRLRRRQYRLDLKAAPNTGSPCTVAQEVEHVLAVVDAVGAPVVLYGHSSGGPVALEALLASPASFAGAVIYDPAAVIGAPGAEHLSTDVVPDGGVGPGVTSARSALLSGNPGQALAIFTRIAAGWPAWLCSLAGGMVALMPTYRRLIPCQIDDLEALERLGNRLTAYDRVNLPIRLLGGERSPAFLKEILDALQGALPAAERVSVRRQGHDGHVRDPQQLAGLIAAFADSVMPPVAAM